MVANTRTAGRTGGRAHERERAGADATVGLRDVLLMPLLVPSPPLYLSAPGFKGCSAVTLAKCPLTRCLVHCGAV